MMEAMIASAGSSMRRRHGLAERFRHKTDSESGFFV
jgi:hypothetical protein